MDDSLGFFHVLGDGIADGVGDEAMGACILRSKTFAYWSELAGDASSLKDSHSSGVWEESAFTS